MNREELIYEVSLNYTELVYYLLNKYGPAEYDYFHRISQGALGSYNKKVSRTNEGLICHHIYEDRGGSLSSPLSAVIQPLSWQNKENLVYCTLLEHLLLHIKIAVLRQRKYKFTEPFEIDDFFTTHGINTICTQINELFALDGETTGWQKKCFPSISDNYKEYILLLQTLLTYIENQCADFCRKDRYIKKGSIIEFTDGKGIITGWSTLKDKVVFEHDGSKRAIDTVYLRQQLTFYDCFDRAARNLCAIVIDYSTGKLQLQKNIYEDVCTLQDEQAKQLAQYLTVDFHGFGFPMFAAYSLDRAQFGSDNADEYLYKGLPSFVNSEESKTLTSKTPYFWIGKLPPEIENSDFYYVVRIKVAFQHHSSNPPFVRYKETGDWSRFRLDFRVTEEKNFLSDKMLILSDSSVINHENKKCNWIKDFSGKVERATVILTLGRDDFDLFKKEHRIISIEYLDGCYFK